MRDGWFKRRFKQVSFATIMSSVAIATLQTYQLHQSSSLASLFEADPDEPFLSSSSSSSSLTETALNRHDNDNDNKNDISVVQRDLTEAVRQATRLLYEESPRLDYWLEQPLPKIYVYDTLDDEWTNVTRISSCVDDNMLAMNDSFREHDVCRWYPHVCSDDSNTKRRFQGREYTSWRYNFNTDVALVELFRGYPARSYDPHEADLLYVIPFPYLSQCYCKRGRDTFWDFGTRCPFGLADIQKHVLSRLHYYNASTKSRHLWILGCDWKTIKAPRFIRTLRQGISLSLGASELCGDSDSHCPLLLHPYLNTKEIYQPNVLMDQPFWQEKDNNENLRYSMYGAFGTPAFLPYRGRFYKEFSQQLPQNGQTKKTTTTTIGGLPAQMLNLGEGRRTEMLQRMELTYQQSVFCLILPGDSPVQKRFFDVLLNGCIPLMPTWPSKNHNNSSWAPNGPAISVTYPFAPVHFRNDPFAGINYEQNVLVTFDGECGVPCAQQAIERVMSNQTELRRLRANIKKYAPLFAFGLDKNAYRYNDAFAAILVNLRHHVTTLMELQTKRRTSTP